MALGADCVRPQSLGIGIIPTILYRPRPVIGYAES